MTLDERDKKMLERLQKETARWAGIRWAMLVMGVALAGDGIVRDEMVAAIVGVGSIAYAIQYWQGNPIFHRNGRRSQGKPAARGWPPPPYLIAMGSTSRVRE